MALHPSTRKASLCRAILANPHRRSCLLLDGTSARVRFVEMHESGDVVFIVEDHAGCGRKIPADQVREII